MQEQREKIDEDNRLLFETDKDFEDTFNSVQMFDVSDL